MYVVCCMYLCMYVCMYVCVAVCVWVRRVANLHGAGHLSPGYLPSSGAPVSDKKLFQGPSKGRCIFWAVPEERG